MESAEVVVIGAGIVGSSVAYYLARSGVDVILLDRRGSLAEGAASQACAGGVRHQARAAVEMSLALYAIKFWQTLGEELEAELQYRQDGMTIVTNEDSLIPVLEKRVAEEKQLGLEVSMVYGPELRELIPGVTTNALAGSHCPLDGHADPLRATSALASAARRRGARLKWGCPALSLNCAKGRMRGVETPMGRISCRSVILAAGAWSRFLGATIGLDLPLEPFALQMMVTARRPSALKQVLGWLGHGISLKQVPSGGFVIGGGWPGCEDLLTGETTLMPGSMSKSALTAVSLFPSLAGVSVIRAWVGIEGFTSDELQIVGPVPEREGLVLATGFSGHGFALGPGVGSLIADYIATESLSELLSPFRITRFDPAVWESPPCPSKDA